MDEVLEIQNAELGLPNEPQTYVDACGFVDTAYRGQERGVACVAAVYGVGGSDGNSVYVIA